MHDDDVIYLAHFYPFSYTQLRCSLSELEIVSKNMIRQPLTYSLGGNLLELLTITDFSAPAEVIRSRPVIVLTNRVHPGEANSSWVLQGLLKYLLSCETSALTLLQRAVFKIAPMLNPDGVIDGNISMRKIPCFSGTINQLFQ